MSTLENLTNVERLILSNQYEILNTLKPDQGYDQLAKMFINGHEWLYNQEIYLADLLPTSEAEYVLDILALYGILKDSYDKLQDKSGIEEYKVKFIGFDGNNEIEYLSFATALARSGRYTLTLPGNDCPNSHMPTTAQYKKMLFNWKNIGKSNYLLTKEQIISILS